MNRKALTYISLSLLCSVGLLAQNWRPIDKGWTDKTIPSDMRRTCCKTRITNRVIAVLEANKLMQDGPKSGEVFSPIRINDWAEQVRKNYAQSNGPLESITWGVKFDYTHSQANVEISFKERN